MAARHRGSEEDVDTMNELDHIQRGLIATWQLWMQWFVWFYGAQVLLLWARPAVFDRLIRVVSWMWILFSLSGAVVAVMVAHYTWSVGRAHPEIGFPTEFAAVGALLNAVPLLAVCLIWRKVSTWRSGTHMISSDPME